MTLAQPIDIQRTSSGTGDRMVGRGKGVAEDIMEQVVKPRRAKRTRPQTPAQRAAYLESREGMQAVAIDIRYAMLRSLRKELRRLDLDAPSSTWRDAAWFGGDRWPDGWVRCNCCGRFNPPQCVGSSGGCDDCRLAAMSPAEWSNIPDSPSGLAITAAAGAELLLRFRYEPPLPPEAVAWLARKARERKARRA